MANSISIIVYPAKDVQKTKQFFNTFLGAVPYVDSPYYIGYKVGDLEIGLDPSGTTIISYTEVDDINASLQTLKDVGAEVVKAPTDVAEGLLVAQVQLDGNTLGLRQQPK